MVVGDGVVVAVVVVVVVVVIFVGSCAYSSGNIFICTYQLIFERKNISQTVMQKLKNTHP